MGKFLFIVGPSYIPHKNCFISQKFQNQIALLFLLGGIFVRGGLLAPTKNISKTTLFLMVWVTQWLLAGGLAVEVAIWNALKRILRSCLSQRGRFFNSEKARKPNIIRGLMRNDQTGIAKCWYLLCTFNVPNYVQPNIAGEGMT